MEDPPPKSDGKPVEEAVADTSLDDKDTTCVASINEILLNGFAFIEHP